MGVTEYHNLIVTSAHNTIKSNMDVDLFKKTNEYK